MDLAEHQRALARLIATGSLPESAAGDPYLRDVAASHGLRVVREIVSHWEAFDVRRSCPLTATALDHAGRFDEVVRVVDFGATSAFAESRAVLFLERVAREEGLAATIARFELALKAVARGDRARHEIAWDRDPAPILEGLVEGRWLAGEAEPGDFRTVLSADVPGLVVVERVAAPVATEL